MRLFAKCLAGLALVLAVASGVPAAERMAVSAETANIRSGPGVEHEQLWQIEKYHPIQVLEKKGEWYRFKDFEGDQGWINASLVDKTPTVIIKAVRCQIRKAPNTGAPVAFSVDKGIPFKVLQVKGQWIQIQHADGDRGWVHNGLTW